MGENSALYIGSGSSTKDSTLLSCASHCQIKIGNNSKISNGKIISRSQIMIGDNFSNGHGLIMVADKDQHIKIGDNCLLSSNIHFRAGNGHSLFDMDKMENISMKNSSIVIGDKVWIGQDTEIIGYANIGKGCVVGAKSLTKGFYNEKSLIYGVPAMIKRTNIEWDIRNNLDFRDYINSRRDND